MINWLRWLFLLNINKKIFVVALQPLFLPSEKTVYPEAPASGFSKEFLTWKLEFPDTQAEVAHLVEHDLAKVGVAGSSPVFRSKRSRLSAGFFWYTRVVELVDTQDLKSCSA